MSNIESVIESILKKIKGVARTCLNVDYSQVGRNKPFYNISKSVLFVAKNEQPNVYDSIVSHNVDFSVPIFELASLYRTHASMYKFASPQETTATCIKQFKKIIDHEDRLFFSLLDLFLNKTNFTSYFEIKDLLLNTE